MLTEFANQKDVELIAFSSKTKGENMLNKKIYNFFDLVNESKKESRRNKHNEGEELIY